MLLALASASHGYQGRGDFAFGSDGRIRRRKVEQELVPFAFTGVSIAHPRLFAGAPDGAFSLNAGVEPGDRGRPRLWHAHGRHLDARRHAGRAGAGRGLSAGRSVQSSLSSTEEGVAVAPTRLHGCVRHAVPDGAGARIAGRRSAGPGGARPAPLELAESPCCCRRGAATRALQEAFLRAANGAAVLLPKIKAAGGGLGGPGPDRRRRGLCRRRRGRPPAHDQQCSTGSWCSPSWCCAGRRRERANPRAMARSAPYAAAGAATPAQAARLAKELARLMDTLEAESVEPGAAAASWCRRTSPSIGRARWSSCTSSRSSGRRIWPSSDLASPVAHRQRLLRAEAERLQAQPAQGAGDRRRRDGRRSGGAAS